jgi:hypothetical protein
MTVREETFQKELIETMFSGRIIYTTPTVPRLVIASSLKRYWNVDMWKRLFELLLNAGYYNKCMLESGGSGEFPVRGEIERCVGEVTGWLREKDGRDLRTSLRRLIN